MCVVEVEGKRVLQPACIVKAGAGMKVQTRSEKVIRARKTILEMLASTMDLSESPEIQAMIQEYGADVERFPDAERREVAKSKMTTRCISAITRSACCAGAACRSARTMRNIPMPSTSTAAAIETQIGTFFDKTIPETTCVLCGQCVGVCPTGALKPKREYLLEQGMSPQEISVLNTGRKKRKNV